MGGAAEGEVLDDVVRHGYTFPEARCANSMLGGIVVIVVKARAAIIFAN